jgi:hypothetical protein
LCRSLTYVVSRPIGSICSFWRSPHILPCVMTSQGVSMLNRNKCLANYRLCLITFSVLLGKGKAVPLLAWGGPECSRKLRFPDFMAQDGGKVVSLRYRAPLPPGNRPDTHFCYRARRPQCHSATGRIISLKNSNDTIERPIRPKTIINFAYVKHRWSLHT